MINQTLLNVYTVFVLLAPVNILSYFTDDASDRVATSETNVTNDFDVNDQMATLMTRLFDFSDEEDVENEKPVTTADTSRAPVIESETIAADEITDTFENWLDDLPVYEEESPQTEFIQLIAPAAILIAEKNGIYPSVMLAQASLESSWGESSLAQEYNNLMGTKGSWNGESITVSTREDINGESVYIDAGFSVYGSWIDSLARYGLLMSEGLEWDANYYSGTWRENAASYKDATAWLQGRYATDSAYESKLNATIQSFNLDQYDEIEPFDIELADIIDELDI